MALTFFQDQLMKHSVRARKITKLSESFHHQLNAYALAATAAGVSVLAFAPPTEAEIIYTPIHHVIKPNNNYNLDLNRDGNTDFVITDKLHCGSSYFCASLTIDAAAGASWVTKHPGFGSPKAYALNKGVTVGASQDWESQRGSMAGDNFLQSGTFNSLGKWASVNNRFLGLRIVVKHEQHYGWARMTVKIDSKTGAITAVLTGYAYETTANKGLIAGKIKGPDGVEKHDPGPNASLTSPIPDPSRPASLGALALGAPGLSVWRRKETAIESR
jgi:hypothetical protein